MELLSSLYRPIPELKQFFWQEIKQERINESEEKLVPLSLIPEKILVRPRYFQQKIKGALPECYIRRGNLKRLVRVAEKLPAGYKLLIFDAWRSHEVQLDLYNRLYERLKQENPQFSEDELKEMTEKNVALPSRDPGCPSPHLTGGAVDLTIVDSKGEMLDMGTGFDEMKRRSHTRYYEELLGEKGNLNEKEEEALNNRRLLYMVMTSEGFTNYPREWWHYDFGNQNWAYMKGDDYSAFYGISFPPCKWDFK